MMTKIIFFHRSKVSIPLRFASASLQITEPHITGLEIHSVGDRTVHKISFGDLQTLACRSQHLAPLDRNQSHVQESFSVYLWEVGGFLQALWFPLPSIHTNCTHVLYGLMILKMVSISGLQWKKVLQY